MTVALAYVAVAAWMAIKYIGPPRPTTVIWPVVAWMVATAVLLLVYVIAPALALLGAVVIENGASTLVFVEGTVKVAEEKADVASATATVSTDMLKVAAYS